MRSMVRTALEYSTALRSVMLAVALISPALWCPKLGQGHGLFKSGIGHTSWFWKS